MYGLLIPFLFLFVGVGVDLGWYYLNVSRLQNAADAAALAGARALVKDDRAFENYYPVQLASNQLPADFDNYENVYQNTFGNVTSGTLYSYKTLEKVTDTLKAGRDLAEEYVRKNLEDDEKVNTSASYQNTLSATDGWSREADSAVKGTVELKYKIVDGKNDVLGPLYYVVSLDEKIKHFLMPGWFEDMDAPVRAVVLLQPHDKGLITPMESLERSMIIDNWEYTKKYKDTTGFYSGKWNHYMAGTTSDQTAIKYANNNPYRTESLSVKTTEAGRDGGQKTAANGNKFYKWNEVDSINIDYQAEVRVSSMFTTDWDLNMGAASNLSNFKSYSHIDSTYPWSIGNGEDKRILFTVDFDESFKTRDESKQADVLWTRIESDPLKNPYNGAGVWVFNSVRQNTLNFSSDNTALTSDGKHYAYRPYVVFYTGPENVDYAVDSNGVLLRHSQPVVINLNKDTNAIFYLPESPVIINGNGNKLTGFVIAKCYLLSVTAEEMTSKDTIELYDGFNPVKDFKGDFEAGIDGSNQTIFFHEKDLVDKSDIENEYKNATLTVKDSGDIYVYEKINATRYPVISFTKDIYAGCTTLEEYFTATREYISNTYTKENYMKLMGLSESQVVMVTFPEENEILRNSSGIIANPNTEGLNYGNFTGVEFPVPNYKDNTGKYTLLDSDPDPNALTKDNKYVKVMLGDEEKYIAKSYLPHFRIKWNANFPYACIYDLKTGLGWNMESPFVCVKPMDDTTSTSDSSIVFTNSKTKSVAGSNQWGDVWVIVKELMEKNLNGNYKADKLTFGDVDGVDGLRYFMLKSEIAALPTEPQLYAKYHAITMLDDDGEILLDDDGKPVVKYVKDNDDTEIEYYTKVDNNKDKDGNVINYIIVDKKGNMLTKPLTSPEVLDVVTVAQNTFAYAQSALGGTNLNAYWHTYTRDPKDPDEMPLDRYPNTEALLDGNYRGNAASHKEKDYRIPALERVYYNSVFNLDPDSCYSYFDIEELWRVNYTYLNVNEFNHTGRGGENDVWKIDDMFFTTTRSEWID